MTENLAPIADINPETGIGREYLKAFGRLNLYLRAVFGTSTTTRIKKFALDNLVRFRHRFRKYEEWFSPEEFQDVITNNNRRYVKRLDEIVDELNTLIENGEIIDASDKSRTLPLFNEAMTIILGCKEFDYKAICQKGDAEINRYFW